LLRPDSRDRGRAGVYELLGHHAAPSAGIRPSGDPWTSEALIFFKQFASCFATHTPMRAALSLRPTCPVKRIKKFNITISEYSHEQIARRDRHDEISSCFGVSYCVAVVLMEGRADNSEFSMASVTDPAIRNLATLATIDTDPSFGKFDATIRIELDDGSVQTRSEGFRSRSSPPARISRPLTTASSTRDLFVSPLLRLVRTGLRCCTGSYVKSVIRP
jgi:2-methylcitrate dehydratase PrpD